MSASEAAAMRQLEQEGLAPSRWSNEPGFVYAAHDHPYGKVLVVVSGSITFTLTDAQREVKLEPGDRLELAPHTRHSAVVGEHGVVCLEAHRAPEAAA
jgi:quercetin dioxygenase-like cupin family protein